MRIATGYVRVVERSHWTSTKRSLSALPFTLEQSARCTVTPRPRVMYPTILSPGTGLQHTPKRMRRSVTPFTFTPPRAVAERREERVHVVEVQQFGHAAQIFVGNVAELALRDAFELLVQQVFAVRDVLVALRALEPRADLFARAGRADHREPVARWPTRGLTRDDLDDVARREPVVERHDAAVDLRADRAMPDVRVDP